MKSDYSKYWYLEKFIMSEVKTNLTTNGFLTTFDFFCIIIWKANRAKSKIAKQLRKRNDDLSLVVKELTSKIFLAKDAKEKMRILFEDYDFRLPIASAILSLLYPESFTIYDVRVCDTLIEYKGLANRSSFEHLWPDYLSFIECVRKYGLPEKSLREIDKALWGKSFYDQLNKDIRENFPVRNKKPEK
jgi:hypothetical protein